jgi:hypothetical protein
MKQSVSRIPYAPSGNIRNKRGRRYDVSETGDAFVISCKRQRVITQLGPLKRASLDHWPRDGT